MVDNEGHIMRTKNIILFIVVFVMVGVVFVSTKSWDEGAVLDRATQTFSAPLRVWVTLDPIGDIIQQVGKERVTVTTVTSADEIPDNIVPDLWVLVSEGVDKWAENIAQQQDVPFVVLRDDVDITQIDYDAEVGRVSPSAPHYYWLSLHSGQNMATALARELAKLEPVNKELFISNAYSYSLLLAQHQQEFLRSIGNSGNVKVIALDHYFDEFLHSFELSPVALFNGEAGGEVFDDLSYTTRYYGADVLLVPDGYATPELYDALDTNAVSVVSVDVFGEGVDDYVTFVRSAVSALLRGVQE